MTESASPPSIGYGSQDTLSVDRIARWRNGSRHVHLWWLDALHGNAAGNELPDLDVARPGHLPGHRDLPG